MVIIEPWQNSTPDFGAAAFCTTKIDDFRASLTLSSLMTWLRRPLKKDQLRGTAAALCATKIDDFRASSTLSSLTTWLRRTLRKDQLFGDLARRRKTSHDVARLLLMVSLEPWRNSTPFFGAAILGHLRRWALWWHGWEGHWGRTSSEGLRQTSVQDYWHELRLAMKYFKQKYWHEFRHCSRQHSTKIN